MFQVIVLSSQRKFLSSTTCATAHEVAQKVLALLVNEVVGSLSIKRVPPKTQKEPAA